jgi:hypothetical protein
MRLAVRQFDLPVVSLHDPHDRRSDARLAGGGHCRKRFRNGGVGWGLGRD